MIGHSCHCSAGILRSGVGVELFIVACGVNVSLAWVFNGMG